MILEFFQPSQHLGAQSASLRWLHIPRSGTYIAPLLKSTVTLSVPWSGMAAFLIQKEDDLGTYISHFQGQVPFTSVPWSEQCTPNFGLHKLEFIYTALNIYIKFIYEDLYTACYSCCYHCPHIFGSQGFKILLSVHSIDLQLRFAK